MERYRSRQVSAEDFDTSLMYDDIEKIRNLEEQEEKDQNDKLSFAGVMALMAGIVFFVTGIMSGVWGMQHWLIDFLHTSMGVVGIGSLLYGVLKTLGLAFRKKELNFPALNVYRKTRPAATENTRTRTRNENFRTRSSYQERTRSYARKQRQRKTTRSKGLMRSRKNRVFAGVAGGLGEFLNISPALIRFSFIATLIFSGFLFMFIYLLLSIVLPANYDFPIEGTDKDVKPPKSRTSFSSEYDN